MPVFSETDDSCSRLPILFVVETDSLGARLLPLALESLIRLLASPTYRSATVRHLTSCASVRHLLKQSRGSIERLVAARASGRRLARLQDEEAEADQAVVHEPL